MEVEPVANDATPGGAADGALLDELSSTLDKISKKPYDYNLHARNVALSQQLGMDDQVDSAREMLSQSFPLPEAGWLEWIEKRKARSKQNPQDLDAVTSVVDLYEKALNHMLSIRICQSYVSFLLEGYCYSRGLPLPQHEGEEPEEDTSTGDGVNETLAAFWTEELTREKLQMVSDRACQHVALGYLVWNRWRDFEADLLRREPSEEQKERIQRMYISRLEDPHDHMDETFQSYSTFISTHFSPAIYEETMISGNEAYSATKANWDRTDIKERELVQAQYAAPAYLSYAAWLRTGKKAASTDPMLARNVFERAIKDCGNDWSVWEAYLQFWKDRLSEVEMPDDPEEEDEVEKEMPEEMQIVLVEWMGVAEKAAKHLPYLADSWVALMRIQERAGLTTPEDTFRQAIGTHLMDKNVEELVKLYIARADYHRRTFEAVVEKGIDPPEGLLDLTQVLPEGIEKIRKAVKKTDPYYYQLEKYLTRFLERFERHEEVEPIWKKATEVRKTDYLSWLSFAEFEIRRNNLEGARSIFLQAVKSRFDYPEYLFEAWTTFESQHGSLEQLETALAEVRRQMRGVNAKRARDAQAQYEAQASQQAEQAASTSAVATNKRPAEESTSDQLESSTKRQKTDHESTSAQATSSLATLAATLPAGSASTTAAVGPSDNKSNDKAKRDRENTTMLVSNLPADTAEADLRKLFGDCGEIRELILFPQASELIATIEFKERESVPMAKTKDKKRIREQEIEVSAVWQATLFVTNFPETTDDKAMRAMFEPYGTILDTRWPSKRFKSTRRFVYIQFASQVAAQNALALHEKELSPGHKMSVLISNPTRKKDRTDVDANQKELYVANLVRSVTEADLRKAFEPYGTLKGIRLMTDDAGKCKGFAFVEYEQEDAARAALALNSTELKKRNISVTIADARAAGTKARTKQATPAADEKQAARDKSFKISKLPAGTQEALIQQAIEKHAEVEKVVVFPARSEAVVELQSAGDVGKLLLLPDGAIQILDTPVTLSAMSDNAKGQGDKATNGSSAAPAGLMPRVFTQRGRGRGGRGRGRGGLGSRPGLAAQAPAKATDMEE